MSFDFASMASLMPPPPPEPPKARSRDEDDYLADRQEEAKLAEFKRLMQEELNRKHQLATPVLPAIPWMPQGPVEPTDESLEVVSASEGATTTAPDTRWFAPPPPTPVAATRDTVRTADPGPGRPDVFDEPDEPDPRAISQVKVLVEPGLPLVQPTEDHHGANVPLVRFPQVVAGHVRNAVKDGTPLTRLDFHISPPNVGPVQLSVALHQGTVSVQLTAQTLAAKQQLEGQVSSIHSILQAHNLTPGQIRVVTGAAGKNGAGASGDKQQQQGFGFFNGGMRKRPSADDGVTVT